MFKLQNAVKKAKLFWGKGVWAGKIKIYNVIKNFKIIFLKNEITECSLTHCDHVDIHF